MPNGRPKGSRKIALVAVAVYMIMVAGKAVIDLGTSGSTILQSCQTQQSLVIDVTSFCASASHHPNCLRLQPVSMSYELLPTSDPSQQQRDPTSSPSERTDSKKNKSFRTDPFVRLILSRLLVALVLLYAMVAGLRALGRSASRFALSSGTACHRNASLKAGLSTLPSHFDLPSGDKIPSVALGKGIYILFPVLCNIKNIVGVWKAKPGEVEAAVKVKCSPQSPQPVSFHTGLSIQTALKTGYRHIDDAWIYRVCA